MRIPSRLSKKGEMWGSHGKRGAKVKDDVAVLDRLTKRNRPKSKMFASIKELFSKGRSVR